MVLEVSVKSGIGAALILRMLKVWTCLLLHALPGMYALSPGTCGPQVSVMHIRQSTHGHVITVT